MERSESKEDESLDYNEPMEDYDYGDDDEDINMDIPVPSGDVPVSAKIVIPLFGNPRPPV